MLMSHLNVLAGALSRTRFAAPVPRDCLLRQLVGGAVLTAAAGLLVVVLRRARARRWLGLLAGAAVWILLGAKAGQREAQRSGHTSEPLRSVSVRADEQVKTRMEQTGAVDVEWGRDREPLGPVR